MLPVVWAERHEHSRLALWLSLPQMVDMLRNGLFRPLMIALEKLEHVQRLLIVLILRFGVLVLLELEFSRLHPFQEALGRFDLGSGI